MISQLRLWWLGLARRERGLTAAAAVVVVCGLLYAIALEPAWLTRARIAREMPALQEQLAEVEALRDEVGLLRQRGFGTQSIDSLRIAAQQSLEREGVAAVVRTEGDRTLVLSASSVPAASWFAWLEQFTREARVRIVRARVARSGLLGMVQAEATLEMPAR